ncbi:MAG TPA: class I SAM-dependent methyltransferase [Dehalococcoidia bacterium]|jgi:SAM-dependent methyltransferase|nr:SAM-dependent methyltransferase [Chloroflexota bacterium]MDP5877180.1 class I SAM-dependent methyltransferase [Dehalococcoidia bacterium]MDP7160521.1 class I SAM-dependent methyltransferase [Dehalococcoidia bacterium]MDP7213092.1 class I SAM-dependent methyltransferase [Dehalococcoidia bacterium]HCV28427.1 class I SAM-dependent methyltransferase [Dehalococcoidia bacterium]|tara:strand:- start:1506 stop:2159 length:654 start_codon:yes stop_codon:yes gene_type:complete
MSDESNGPAPGEDIVRWVYSSTSPAQLAARYDYWAANYELDTERDYGRNDPQMTLPLVQKFVPAGARILDAGVGTGLVGQLMAGAGYDDLIGIDISTEMMAEAEAKGVYRDLKRMVLGETLEFETDSFDAVTCVGVLTFGHAPASSLREFVRVTRPGGYVIYTVRPDVREQGGFIELEDELTEAGLWKLAEVTDEFPSLPKGLPESMLRVWAFEVMG